jgi:hypothetical protein
MAPQTVDFVSSGDATEWRRTQLRDLLAAMKAGERVVLKVLGWGEIHGQFNAYDGSSLTLASGREVSVDELIDIHPAGGRVAAW